MKALIVFESAHGCTEKCAIKLRDQLLFATEVIRLRDNPNPSLDAYDAVIIGGSIHMGEINSRIRKFYENNLPVLKTKMLGLYICCMHEGETALQQFENSFPEELRTRANALGIFGGEFSFNKMNFFEKAIVKKIAKVDSSISRIREDEVFLFAEKMNKSKVSPN
jgi:menaquinone-dependent protoporphyrinogen oxidase